MGPGNTSLCLVLVCDGTGNNFAKSTSLAVSDTLHQGQRSTDADELWRLTAPTPSPLEEQAGTWRWVSHALRIIALLLLEKSHRGE